MPDWLVDQTEFGPQIRGQSLLAPLREVLDNGALVLMQKTASGSYYVGISYGSGDLDQVTRERFDESEFGIWPNFVGALRYALGAFFSPPE